VTSPSCTSLSAYVASHMHFRYNPDFDLDSSAQQREFQAWPGFTNLGNTCYMNAVLQQFLSAPWFSHVIMSAKCAPADDCLLYECQKMIANHFYSDLAVTCTRPLVDVSKIWGASIDSREPHDAQEYLMSLLDQIGADMQAEDKENLDGLFHGEISSHVTHGCKHGHTSVMKGSFVCLSLNIDGISSIHDCIQSTLQQEDISVDCAQCSSLKLEECHQASKKDFISACPPVLVIHLKRFLFDISSDSRVATVLKNVPSIPSLLDFSPFLSPDCPDLGLYDLHGMVLHVGSLEYGHYTSVFSHESPDSSKAREWLFADDHKVSVLPEDEVCGTVHLRNLVS
jgi:ubiquitin C-terminal hydrolase